MTALICCLMRSSRRRWILSVRHTNRHCIRSLLYRPRIYLLRWGHKLHYLRKDWDDEKHVKDVFVALLLYECPKTLFRDPTTSTNMWIIYSFFPVPMWLIMPRLIRHLNPIIGHNIYHLFSDGNRAESDEGPSI